MDNNNWLKVIPEDIIYYIYKIYFKEHVLSKITKYNPSSIWIEPSRTLSNLCEDFGCLQTGKNIINNVFDLVDDYSRYNYNKLLDKNGNVVCEDCKNVGWPCITCGNLHSSNIGVLCKWTCTNDPRRRIDYYFPELFI